MKETPRPITLRSLVEELKGLLDLSKTRQDRKKTLTEVKESLAALGKFIVEQHPVKSESSLQWDVFTKICEHDTHRIGYLFEFSEGIKGIQLENLDFLVLEKILYKLDSKQRFDVLREDLFLGITCLRWVLNLSCAEIEEQAELLHIIIECEKDIKYQSRLLNIIKESITVLERVEDRPYKEGYKERLHCINTLGILQDRLKISGENYRKACKSLSERGDDTLSYTDKKYWISLYVRVNKIINLSKKHEISNRVILESLQAQKNCIEEVLIGALDPLKIRTTLGWLQSDLELTVILETQERRSSGHFFRIESISDDDSRARASDPSRLDRTQEKNAISQSDVRSTGSGRSNTVNALPYGRDERNWTFFSPASSTSPDVELAKLRCSSKEEIHEESERVFRYSDIDCKLLFGLYQFILSCIAYCRREQYRVSKAFFKSDTVEDSSAIELGELNVARLSSVKSR